MKKIDQLTFTRFLAALSVVVFHTGRKVFPFQTFPLNPLITTGGVAVIYFFVLSGFVMSLVYYRPERKLDIGGFYLARFSRIYPIYLLSFVLACLYYVDKMGSIRNVDYLAGLLLAQSWIPRDALAFNFPAWSLAIEIFFYLLFPFVVIWAARQPTRRLIWISIIFWAVNQAVVVAFARLLPAMDGRDNFINYFPLFHLSSFLLGTVGGIWFLRMGQHEKRDSNINLWLSALGLGLIGFVLLERRWVHLPLTTGLLAPFFVVVILGLAVDTSAVSRILGHRTLIALGDASYGVYILHMPVRWMLDDFLMAIGVTIPSALNFYLYVIILVGISIGLFVWLERPARDWLRSNPQRLLLICFDIVFVIIAISVGFMLRVGVILGDYTSAYNYTLRFGVPAYLGLMILFRSYKPIKIGTLFRWGWRSLLPVSIFGAMFIAGLLYFATRADWIQTFPRSLPLVSLVTVPAFLLFLRVIIERQKPSLIV